MHVGGDSGIISRTITYVYKVAATDASNTTLRARVLQFAQEIFDDTWTVSTGPWKRTRGTVSIADGAGVGDLPATFGQIGRDGKVLIATKATDLSEEPWEAVAAQWEEGVQGAIGRTTDPRWYSVYGFNTSTARRTIRIQPNSGAFTLAVHYDEIPPTLTDADTVASNLVRIPVDYHFRVLLVGVRMMAMMDKGDARASFFADMYESGKQWMLHREREGRDRRTKMPSALPYGQW